MIRSDMRNLIYSIVVMASMLITCLASASGKAGYEMYLPEGLNLDVIIEPSDLVRIGSAGKMIFQLNEAGQPTILSGETFLTLKSREGEEVIPPFRAAGSGRISHYAWMPDGTLMIVSGKSLGVLTTEGFMPVLTLPSRDMKVEPASDELCYLYGGGTKEQQRNLYLLKKSGKLLLLLQADEPIKAVAGDGETTFIASGGSIIALTSGKTEIMYTAGEVITSLAVSKDTGGIFFATTGSVGYIHEKDIGFEFIKGKGSEVRTFKDSLFLFFPDGQMLKASPASLFGKTAETAAGGRPEGIDGHMKEMYVTASFLWPFLFPYFYPYLFFSLLVGRAKFTLLDGRDIGRGSKSLWTVYGLVAIVAVMAAHPARLQGALWSAGTLFGVLLIPYLFTDLARRFSDILNSVLRGFLFPAAAWIGAVLVMVVGLFGTALLSFALMIYFSDNLFSFTEYAFVSSDLYQTSAISLGLPLCILLVTAGLRMFRPPANEYFSKYFETYRANRLKTIGGGKLVFLILGLILWGLTSILTTAKAEQSFFPMMIDNALPGLLAVIVSSCAGLLIWNLGLFFYRIARPEADDKLTFWHKASIGLLCGIIVVLYI